jgi:hypothetical protein
VSWFPQPFFPRRFADTDPAVPASAAPRKLATPWLIPWIPTRRAQRLFDDRPLVPSQRPPTAAMTMLYLPFAAAGRGLYRVFNTAGYRFFRSNVAPPATTDTPFATNATLPFTPASTYADGTWYLSMSYFDGVLDSGFLPIGPHGETYLVVEIAGGVAVGTRPSMPTGANLRALAGGVIQINAYYSGTADAALAAAATQWSIAYTTDGSTPASGSPTITPAIVPGPLNQLAYNLPAQADGTTVKVQLQTRRPIGGGLYLYSLPSTVLSAVADAIGPTAPLTLTAWPGALPQEQ